MAGIVYNSGAGSFSLSARAKRVYESIAGCSYNSVYTPRHDPTLVRVVEIMGGNLAGNGNSVLAILTVAPGSRYYVANRGFGTETVILEGEIEWTTADDPE